MATSHTREWYETDKFRIGWGGFLLFLSGAIVGVNLSTLLTGTNTVDNAVFGVSLSVFLVLLGGMFVWWAATDPR